MSMSFFVYAIDSFAADISPWHALLMLFFIPCLCWRAIICCYAICFFAFDAYATHTAAAIIRHRLPRLLLDATIFSL